MTRDTTASNTKRILFYLFGEACFFNKKSLTAKSLHPFQNKLKVRATPLRGAREMVGNLLYYNALII